MPNFSIYLLVASCLTPVTGADENTKAQGAYPGQFTRPPSQGKNYDTWADAKGADIGENKVNPSRLPSRVDNSIRPEYPAVYKQKWGSCGQFASVASIFTYEMNVLNATAADTDATRFPAHFSWNMMNRAKNVGSEAYHGWEVAKRIGIPTAKSYGGVRLNKIGIWPNGYSIWREAMEFRVSGYRYTPANTVVQLNEARGWLFDRNQPDQKSPGGIMALDGRMGELKKVTVTIPEGHHEAGKDIWTKWGPSGYGHGITCVGYDDQVGVDLNGDGKITNDLDLNNDGKVTLADWERGAYIVVNSWGEKWSGDGRIYLLYSAMVDPTWKRGNYLGRVEVARYQPRQTLQLKFTCTDRSNLRLTIGIASNQNTKEPEHQIAPEAFNGWPLFGKANAGNVPLAGPDDDTPLEVGIDLTPLFAKIPDPENARIFLNISCAKDSDAHGEIHKCAIRHYGSKGKLLGESPFEISKRKFGKNTLQFSTPSKIPKEEKPSARTTTPHQKPNVIVIITDDQGWADIGYNNPKVYTPNLDQLARTGAIFTRHYVMPQCTPTRVALMTGRYPSRFGPPAHQANNKPAFPRGTPTLAEMFQDQNYHTFLSGKWHLGSTPEHGPNHFGFDHSHGSLTGAVGMYQHRYHDISDTPYDPTWHRNHEIIPGFQNGHHVTDLTRDEAVNFIRKERSNPFFIYLPFHAPHTPLDERGHFIETPTQPDPSNPNRWLNEDKIKWFNDPKGIIQSEPSRDKRLLLATVHHLDSAIGDILKALEETKQRDNTLILFSSDNGPWVNNRGGGYPDNYPLKNYNQPDALRGKKLDVWEGGIHVPGFINWPTKIKPSRIATPVHIIDWFPTLAAILNQTLDIPFDGLDLSPLFFEAKPLPDRDLYWIWASNINRWALRHRDWKIVKYGKGEPTLTQWQLFNLENDPEEKNNLASKHPDILKRLHQRFLRQRSKDRNVKMRSD